MSHIVPIIYNDQDHIITEIINSVWIETEHFNQVSQNYSPREFVLFI